MYLQTNLKEFTTARELKDYINENDNVMVCCGRMGPMCIPVYDVMEEMVDEEEYSHVRFAVMGFDNPEASVIRNAPECRNFMGLPFTIYYRNGEIAAATSSIQSREQISDILNSEFVLQP